MSGQALLLRKGEGNNDLIKKSVLFYHLFPLPLAEGKRAREMRSERRKKGKIYSMQIFRNTVLKSSIGRRKRKDEAGTLYR